jgi:hypothetical protein
MAPPGASTLARSDPRHNCGFRRRSPPPKRGRFGAAEAAPPSVRPRRPRAGGRAGQVKVGHHRRRGRQRAARRARRRRSRRRPRARSIIGSRNGSLLSLSNRLSVANVLCRGSGRRYRNENKGAPLRVDHGSARRDPQRTAGIPVGTTPSAGAQPEARAIGGIELNCRSEQAVSVPPRRFRRLRGGNNIHENRRSNSDVHGGSGAAKNLDHTPQEERTNSTAFSTDYSCHRARHRGDRPAALRPPITESPQWKD